jgi:hypothetical protein
VLTFNKIVHFAAVNAEDISMKYRTLSVVWRSKSSLRKLHFYKVFILYNRYSGQLMNPRARLVHKSLLTGPYSDPGESCLPLRTLSLASLTVFVILPSETSFIEWPLLWRFVKQMSFFSHFPRACNMFRPFHSMPF